MKRFIETTVLIISVITGIYLTCFSGNPVRYSECMIDEKEFEAIIAGRTQNIDLLDALNFNEETLFFDDLGRTFYYSLIEGDAGAYDPVVKITGGNKDLKIAFLEERITEEGIKNNKSITVLAYTGEEYCSYFLKCTTLPLMNIECMEEIMDEAVSMNIVLFDNRQDAVQRVTTSAGSIHIRGVTARSYPKKGYRFSLTQDSLGGNVRTNQISLLGMRQDDDWLLYAAYNDQEKIRNVFSSNLWEYTCATDNAQGINAGMEYKYLELFINGEYWGLYALGYPIDEKQLELNKENKEEALYKIVDWTSGNTLEYTPEGYIKGYVDKGADNGSENWIPLQNYYDTFYSSLEDNEKLYSGIDVDNMIDIYLFYNLIQGTDNVSKERVKNQYFSIHDRQGELIAMYSPWDMDNTWGNTWRDDFPINDQQPYTVSEKYNHVMESGIVNQLIVNGDDSIWEKIFDKYRYLRENGWSNENINFLLDEYEENIFDSGAYLRDMERWPEGTYIEAANGLCVFRAFVMGRLEETDEYFERLEKVCRESLFIRRSAQYASFDGGSFIIEINNKELLTDSDYIDLFEYMGIDIAAVTEEVRFIIAKPSEGKYEYLSELGETEGDRETCAGKISFLKIREGVYKVSLDGTVCCISSAFSRPAIRMVSVKDDTADTFDFVRENDVRTQTSPFESLSAYLDGLGITKYKAVIEINDPDIWQDFSYIRLFESLGISEEAVNGKIDFIVWDGMTKDTIILEDFHVSGSTCDMANGVLSLFVNEQGEYGVYVNDRECFVSSSKKNAEEGTDIRIILLDPDTCEVVENIVFTYEDPFLRQ